MCQQPVFFKFLYQLMIDHDKAMFGALSPSSNKIYKLIFIYFLAVHEIRCLTTHHDQIVAIDHMYDLSNWFVNIYGSDHMYVSWHECFCVRSDDDVYK